MTEEQEKVYYLISNLPEKLNDSNAIIEDPDGYDRDLKYLVGNVKVLKEIVEEWKQCIE